MGWQGHLRLDYRVQDGRTIAHDAHDGPLRVLQRLYPEGPGVCHHVLVHPPGGIAGGDHLHITAHLADAAHALITTPGATRFYRSDGPQAIQHAQVHLAPHSRLEWLPLEALAYSGCIAQNGLEVHLQAGAAMMGWDLVALGLPAAEAPFVHGRFVQDLSVHHGIHTWRERGRLQASDTHLLNAGLGWDGRRVLGVLWMAWAQPTDTDGTALKDAARALCEHSPLRTHLGVTQPWAGALNVVVVRGLADRVEPLMQCLEAVRAAWRQLAWGLSGSPPRIWRT